MFSEEEKERARQFGFSLFPSYELKNYLYPRYLPIIDEQNETQSLYKIPINLPQEIVLFWHDKQLPRDIEESIRKIKEVNIDYSVILFHADEAYDFIKLHYGYDLGYLFKHRCIHPVMQSDLFRLCYLLQKGGVYIDIDVECYDRLENIFAYQDFDCFLFYALGNPCCVENGFIACVPNNQIIAACLERIQRHLTEKRSFNNIWDCTGPGVFSIVILEFLMKKIISNESFISPLEKLKLVSNNVAKRAFTHVELNYKRSSLGNWRSFRLPRNLYRL